MSVISRFARKVSGRDLPLWRSALRWIVLLGVAGIVAGAAAFFALYTLIGIPNANADFETQTTNVYYSDGTHKIGSFSTQDRQSVTMDKIPASMQAAVVAAEDRTFYTNRGIDVKGILRAARNNATSDSTEGASTITQQYVKVLYLTQERTITRKVKEAILSIKIHNQLSKSEILEDYLNTIYFGNGAYGVEVASQTYFGHSASKLTVPESAALATIINSPSYYDPYSEGGKDRIVQRYNYVLDGMAKAGSIDNAQLAQYRDKLPTFDKKTTSDRYGGTKGFLLKTVELQMDALEFTPAQINGGGLRIVTTFSYAKQKAAVEAVKAQRPQGLKELHVAIASVEPGTGALRAMYGGPDYLKSQLNWAMLGSQPGSSFKPFAVAAALEDGYSLKTVLNGNSPIVLENGDEVENQGDSGGQSYGRVSLEKATEDSVNTAFLDMTMQMTDGPAKIKAAAQAAGIPGSVIDDIDDVPVVSLGYAPVPTVDMANGYATFAAKGKTAPWFVIEHVEDASKASLYDHKVTTTQGIPADIAADVTSALQKVVSVGTGTNGRTICPTAGKTGTATYQSSPTGTAHVSSSWFVGYTPKLATAVMYNRGTGNEALDGYMSTFYGGQFPANTFKAYMNGALEGSDCGDFPPAANLTSDKGTDYRPPPPRCDSNENLNGSQTACVAKPTPTPTPTPEPTPTTEPPPADPTPFPCTNPPINTLPPGCTP